MAAPPPTFALVESQKTQKQEGPSHSAIWPKEKPISVRISATDWVEGGLSNAEMLKIASLLKEAKVDIINVSTGQVTKKERPIYGRMFQVPYADQIRNELRVPTIVAGNFTSADQANTAIAAGRCDMVAMGRSIMNEPHFVLSGAKELCNGADVPPR